MDESKPPAPQEPQQPKEELPPLTPRELRASYLKRAVVVAVFLAWFVHDGWFNPDIHSKAFNKLGSVLLAWGFVYCLSMAVKSHLAMKRQPTPGSGVRLPIPGKRGALVWLNDPDRVMSNLEARLMKRGTSRPTLCVQAFGPY